MCTVQRPSGKLEGMTQSNAFHVSPRTTRGAGLKGWRGWDLKGFNFIHCQGWSWYKRYPGWISLSVLVGTARGDDGGDQCMAVFVRSDGGVVSVLGNGGRPQYEDIYIHTTSIPHFIFSKGLLNPPRRFIYCLHVRSLNTCALPSTTWSATGLFWPSA